MNRFILLLLWLGCGLIYVVSFIWGFVAILVGSDRAWRMIVASDRLLNAATGGKDTETMSSRSARGRDEGVKVWCLLCKFLDAVNENHCNNSRGV
jgi:hypothetical protein